MKNSALFRDKKLLCVLAVIFVVMLVFSSMTPLLADDFNYAFDWCSGERLHTVRDIAVSMQGHRNFTHGRIIAGSFACAFMILPKPVFYAVNALVNTAFAFALHLISGCFRKKDEEHFVPFCMLGMLMWCFAPSFGQIFLWLDGACNYLGALFFISIFLIPFFKVYEDDSFKLPRLAEVLLFFEAFVAGSFSESGSISACFIAGCILALMFITKKRPSLPRILDFIAAVLGFLWLMSAPGLQYGERGSFSIASIFARLLPLFDKLVEILSLPLVIACAAAAFAVLGLLLYLIISRRHRKLLYGILFAGLTLGTLTVLVLTISRRFEDVTGLLGCLQALVSAPEGNILASCFIFFALNLLGLYRKVDIKLILLELILCAGSFGSAAAFLFAAYVPSRGFIYLTLYLSIGSVLMASELAGKGFVKPKKILCAVLAVIFALSFFVAALDIFDISKQKAEREGLIEAALASGQRDVELPGFTYATKYSPAYGLDDVTSGMVWPNNIMAEYYGLDNIIGIEK